MTHSKMELPDPRLDLVLERVVDVPRALVWAAWTTPELLKQWFCPVPWQVVDCEMDLRPGGIFRTVFRSPEGQEFPNVGCYLEVIKYEKLVWTSALGPGFRPNQGAIPDVPDITVVISLANLGQSTRYTAIALHVDEEARTKHEKMGFHEGWGIALDQLVAVAKKINAK